MASSCLQVHKKEKETRLRLGQGYYFNTEKATAAKFEERMHEGSLSLSLSNYAGWLIANS